jgi:chromosome segregation ATPase
VGAKRLGEPGEDALLAEISRGYSREYLGRDGWTAGALWDSVHYTFRLVGKSASRPLAIRRLQKERASRERVRLDQLVQLGELALGLKDLDSPALGEFRDRLLELEQEVEMRDEEREELKNRLAELDRDNAAAERQHTIEDKELEAQINSTEEKLRPEEAAHRNAITKARAAERDAHSLAQQIDRGQAELRALSGRPGSGQDADRLKDRIGKWEADRRILEEEAPRLVEKAERLLPEIEQLRKELARAQQARRDHREEGIKREAEHRRERSRLVQEMERLNVAKEALAVTRRGLWLECGRQVDIDRPLHDNLEEIYHVIDHTIAEIHRFDREIEIAQAHPGPPSYDALKRAGVALSGLLFLFILLLVIVT